MADDVRAKFWGGQLDAVLEEIARNASLCSIKLLDPGVIERVLKNDESVSAQKNAIAFKKLRELLMLGFVTQEKAYDKLGAVEADAMITVIRDHLKERFAGKLGGASSGNKSRSVPRRRTLQGRREPVPGGSGARIPARDGPGECSVKVLPRHYRRRPPPPPRGIPPIERLAPVCRAP